MNLATATRYLAKLQARGASAERIAEARKDVAAAVAFAARTSAAA